MFKRTNVLDKALRRRVAVNFLENDFVFTGRLAEYDEHTFVLEQCETHALPGETAQPIKGRQYVDRIHAFLTELP